MHQQQQTTRPQLSDGFSIEDLFTSINTVIEMGKLNIEAKEAPDSITSQADQDHLLLKYTELSTLKEFMTSYEKSMLNMAGGNSTEESKSDLS